MDKKFRSLDFDPRNLPKEHLEAIGLACTCYAQTEDHVQMAIGGCLGLDAEYMWAVTTHLSANLREDVLKSVVEIKIDDLDDLDEIDVLLVEIKLAGDNRNAIAHQLWCVDEETGEVFVVKTSARTGLQVDVVPMPLSKIQADAKFIYEAGIKFLAFFIKRGLMPTLPPRDRPRIHKNKAARKARKKK